MQPEASQHGLAEEPPSTAELIRVSAAYETGANVVTALKEVSFSIGQGEFVAIQGRSGSGKSTLLRVLAGLLPPTNGVVAVNGMRLEEARDAELSLMRRRQVGYVHQFFDLIPDLDVRRNVALPLILDGVSSRECEKRVASVLELLEIAPLAQRRPDELSGGQMARAAIARALVIEPALVLADEPTATLDLLNAGLVLDAFEEASRNFGAALVVATHDPNVAERADRIIRIEDGMISDCRGG